MGSTYHRPTIAFPSTVVVTPRTTGNLSDSTNTTTCPATPTSLSRPTLQPKPPSTSPSPTVSTPSLITTPAAYTLPGGLSAGLMLIGNALPSTSKPTHFSGVWPSLAFTPSRPHTHSMPTATIYLSNGSENVTKAPSQPSLSSNCLICRGYTHISPDHRMFSTMDLVATPYSAPASSLPSGHHSSSLYPLGPSA